MQLLIDLISVADGFSPILGQISNGDIKPFTEKAIGFLQGIGLVLAVGAMIFAGYSVSIGETSKAVTAFIGAMIAGGSPFLVEFAFSVAQ